MESEDIMFYVAISFLAFVIISYLYDQYFGDKESFDDDDDMDDIKEIEEKDEDKKITISEDESQVINEEQEVDMEPEPVSTQVLPAIAEEEYAPVNMPGSLLSDEKPKKRRCGKKSQKP